MRILYLALYILRRLMELYEVLCGRIL